MDPPDEAREVHKRDTTDGCVSTASSTSDFYARSSHTSTDHDEDLQEMVQAYQDLTSVSRLLLKKMCMRFIKDPAFRATIEYQLDRPKYELDLPKSSPIFRFMDLPTELRVRVYEYVLYNSEGLTWTWLTRRNGVKVGYFEELRSRKHENPDYAHPDRAAIARVSKQMHAETRGLIYHLNTLSFKGYHDGPPRFAHPRLPTSLLEYQFFRAHALTLPVTAVLSIRLRVFAGMGLESTLKSLDRQKDTFRNIEIRLVILDWYLVPTLNVEEPLDDDDDEISKQRAACPYSARDIDKFYEQGREMLKTVLSHRSLAPNVCWRVVPRNTATDCKLLVGAVSTEEYELAWKWITQGIDPKNC